ncbi:MAG: homoserine kinase [Candidatus Fonsibacter sp.]|jgi:homoserine kinase type II|nr:homoserine kinase [Candidatus Fonsibacter sp.]MBP7836581.1 homoserine kinase [Candidatus Fonsibacter sp.]MBU3733540.1 homoserine kinase [Candidatus Fonsibacter sp.]MCF8523260.1 homoserine kinase [Candidatus Fonsibacter sp.]
MAVYTKLEHQEVRQFLEQYNINNFKDYKGITEGVENTNYLIKTSEQDYILTIYEKRVDENDLPFFIKLLSYLSENKFPCPKPIANKNNEKINRIKNKNAALVTFLNGQSKNKITSEECFEIGKITAQLHEITKKFDINRKNNLSIENWESIFEKTIKQKIDLDESIIKKTKNYLNFLKDKWPKNLPQGIIHADLFPDNIFFTNNKVSGIIDFYFACNDFFAYEIAICINSLCFDNNSTFNMTKAKNLIDGYTSIRTLSEDEKKYLPILSMGAAMRFFLTRLYDFYHTDNKADVKIKDPFEYLKKIEFHSTIKNFNEYFI